MSSHCYICFFSIVNVAGCPQIDADVCFTGPERGMEHLRWFSFAFLTKRWDIWVDVICSCTEILRRWQNEEIVERTFDVVMAREDMYLVHCWRRKMAASTPRWRNIRTVSRWAICYMHLHLNEWVVAPWKWVSTYKGNLALRSVWGDNYHLVWNDFRRCTSQF